MSAAIEPTVAAPPVAREFALVHVPTKVATEPRPDRAHWAARAARASGRAVLRGAGWAAARVADGVRAIDPDVRRTVIQAPMLGLTHLGGRVRRIEAKPADGHRPVLFLHGLGAHPGEFGPMRAAFRLAGRSRTYALGFFAHESTPEMAERVRMAVADMLRVNGLPDDAQVDMIAHSMGGLVARYALRDAATAARVHTLITLGTPHAGTHLARLAATTKVLDLRRGSTVVQALGEQVPWPRSGMPRLASLWSDADVLVHPHTSACVAGAHNVPTHGVTHVGFLLDPGIWRVAYELLDDASWSGSPAASSAGSAGGS